VGVTESFYPRANNCIWLEELCANLHQLFIRLQTVKEIADSADVDT